MKIHYTNSKNTSKNKDKNPYKKQIVNLQKISLL